MYEFIAGAMASSVKSDFRVRTSSLNTKFGSFDEVAYFPATGTWYVGFEDCLYGPHEGMHDKSEDELKTIVKDIINRHLLEKL